MATPYNEGAVDIQGNNVPDPFGGFLERPLQRPIGSGFISTGSNPDYGGFGYASGSSGNIMSGGGGGGGGFMGNLLQSILGRFGLGQSWQNQATSSGGLSPWQGSANPWQQAGAGSGAPPNWNALTGGYQANATGSGNPSEWQQLATATGGLPPWQSSGNPPDTNYPVNPGTGSLAGGPGAHLQNLNGMGGIYGASGFASTSTGGNFGYTPGGGGRISDTILSGLINTGQINGNEGIGNFGPAGHYEVASHPGYAH